jgi:AcrR family transcriptional regulator
VTTHRRSDARRNHDRVVAAARELFAEHGLGVTVPQVAERAGVGRATVYRSYPTKEDLVAAVAADGLERLQTGARAALDDTERGLDDFVLTLFDTLAGDRGLATALFEGRLPAAGRLIESLGELLRGAAAAGQARADSDELDVRVVLCGAIRQLIVLQEYDPAIWRRYALMVLNAFRA